MIRHIERKKDKHLKGLLNKNYYVYTYKEKPFSGLKIETEAEQVNKTEFLSGYKHGIATIISNNYSSFSIYYNNDFIFTYIVNNELHLQQIDIGFYYDDLEYFSQRFKNGKSVNKIEYNVFDEKYNYQETLKTNPEIVADIEKNKVTSDWLETYVLTSGGGRKDRELYQKKVALVAIAYFMKKDKEAGIYDVDFDLIPFFQKQEALKSLIIKEDNLPETIQYIAGVDVAYNEEEQKMVGAIVVLDATTLEIIEQAYHEMEIAFPYIPGLFSFREIPPLLEAYKKLKIKPDLIVCDGQGIAHPKGVGMATHLGIELDKPTIGCAKKRLVGHYEKEKLGANRGDLQHLIWDNESVGAALRTQTNIKPMFVSIGHKISLETAIDWVLKLCSKYRLPETTRQSDQLVNQLMKERTEYDFLGDDVE